MQQQHSCEWDGMKQPKHQHDYTIIRLLQEKGLTKSEAKVRLKKEVYTLNRDQIGKVKNYAEHFGIQAKQQIIDEILDLRREQLIDQLS